MKDPDKTHQLLKSNVGYLLNRSAQVLRDKLSEALKEVPFSFHEYVVLRLIELELAETQQDVGRLSGIDRSSMVALLDGLEDRDLILRTRDPQDRRKHQLTMTPKGRKTLSHAKRIAGRVHKEFLSPLTEEQWIVLQEALSKLIGV
ncbi:MAG: MarR family transcriptional regulator [Candidatus Obscuribacter sp.]|jgi:DNA-binding MarR family transcriptional regulator|nr:MarR family transcriptional regulator [Candidatus Obscuribacter sp.]MBK7840767.1 MarR family transcriptional regulator [Candidatus Obscuribacter sp.]MBK9202930.1 MarR family transcriptional regulator [Candidatus Obscuribacter sp.]MBK9620978.1 MarR family transcriptional regulator [Candidatus Obscuribacter sp.]MBL0185528.1 MarR family transcriptional regulator [Candidatus Obscuribacter sp.]